MTDPVLGHGPSTTEPDRQPAARSSPSSATRRARRGGPGPRLRRPVLAADRAARSASAASSPSCCPHHVGVEEVRRASPKAPDPLRWPAPRSTSEGAPTPRPGAAGASASRCWASVTACRRWCWRSAARSRAPRSASSAAPTLTVDRAAAACSRGLPEEQACWMSHRDTVYEAPEGFTALASSTESPVAAFEDADRGLYGIQFHPEVVHTPYGHRGPRRRSCATSRAATRTWSAASIIDEQVERIRAQVGDGRGHLRALRRRRLRRSPRCSSTRRSATS